MRWPRDWPSQWCLALKKSELAALLDPPVAGWAVIGAFPAREMRNRGDDTSASARVSVATRDASVSTFMSAETGPGSVQMGLNRAEVTLL